MRLDDNEECVLLVKNSLLTSLDPLLELLSECNFFSDYEPLEKDDLKELINESEAIKNYFDEKAKLKLLTLINQNLVVIKKKKNNQEMMMILMKNWKFQLLNYGLN
jgi:hypothetical protein